MIQMHSRNVREKEKAKVQFTKAIQIHDSEALMKCNRERKVNCFYSKKAIQINNSEAFKKCTRERKGNCFHLQKLFRFMIQSHSRNKGEKEKAILSIHKSHSDSLFGGIQEM